MSDDYSQRRHRSSDSIARSGQGRNAPSGNDPLAELARLIGQTDPFGDSARFAESVGAPPAVDWTAPLTPPQQAFSSQEFSFNPAAPARPPSAGHVDPPSSSAQPRDHLPAQDYDASPHGNELYQVEPAVPSYLTQRGPAPAVEAPAYHPAAEYGNAHDDAYDDAPAGRRRIGVVAVAALFGLAVVGTAGAFGYRAVFGGSSSHVPPVIKADTGPLKIVPKETEARKTVSDRVTADTEKMVPREERPVDISQRIVAPAAATPAPVPAVQPLMNTRGNGVLSSEPKKVRTIVIRPDGSEMPQALASPMPPQAPAVAVANAGAPAPVPQRAAPVAPPLAPARPAVAPHDPAPKPVRPVAVSRPGASAPLSLNPAVETRPVRTANAGSTSLAAPVAAPNHTSAGGYAVQVSSQRSEADAKAAYRGLQNKYGKELGSQPMFVHKVDLGAKGIYYRTMVGPFASASEATQLCSSLKSAGGSCLVQRN
jgi:hypothetical protein